MKLVSTLLLFALAAFGQSAVNPTEGPPPSAYVRLLDYSGTSVIYSGLAPQFMQVTNQWLKRSDSTLTNISVATNVATATCGGDCGVWVGMCFGTTGATVDTDLNKSNCNASTPTVGYIVLTVPTSSTFTFATANVADGTYTDATLVLSTNQPLTTQRVWAIKAFKYDGSGNVTHVFWANATVGTSLAWSTRTSY